MSASAERSTARRQLRRSCRRSSAVIEGIFSIILSHMDASCIGRFRQEENTRVVNEVRTRASSIGGVSLARNNEQVGDTELRTRSRPVLPLGAPQAGEGVGRTVAEDAASPWPHPVPPKRTPAVPASNRQ